MALKGLSPDNLIAFALFVCFYFPLFLKPLHSQTAGARVSGQGSQPPHSNTHARNPDHLYTSPQQDHGNPQALRNDQLNANTHRQTDQTHTNGLLHGPIMNNNPPLHNAFDNPTFTQADEQNINTHVQQQNPNILIQAGPAQGNSQLPAVQVSLNTPPAQQNNGAQMPTVHVNLNSFSANGHQTQPESSFPFNSTSNQNVSQAQQNLTHTGLSNPRMQNGLAYYSEDQFNDRRGAGQPGLIPTGYTHSGTVLQRNAKTQTYLPEPDPHGTSERISSGQNTPASLSPRQIPWDRLRGTPAYPSGTVRQGQTSNDNYSNTTDYTTHPPIREKQNRSLSQSETASRSRAPARNAAPSAEKRRRSRPADLSPNTRSAAETEATDRTHKSPPSQQGIRRLITSLIASRHESTPSDSPQTRPRSSQQVSAGQSAVSQGRMSQQGLNAPQADDTRALADPNHLPQMHMAPQRSAAPSQNPVQGHGTHTQPVADGAKQPRQGGAAPQANVSNLTYAAVRAHTHRTQTVQNRRQQTQAALLHPNPQAQVAAPVAAAAAAQHPPIPPPVIPLARFQSLPKKSLHHRSPARGPQPPVNMPVAQRPQHPQHHHNVRQMPRGAHRHVHGRRPAAHTTHPQQVSQP